MKREEALEKAIEEFLEVHKSISERGCMCWFCQKFRKALKGEYEKEYQVR